MKIYNSGGTLVLDAPVEDSSYRNRAIMGDHNLTLKYHLAVHVELPVGCYCDFEGVRYTLKRPENLKMRHSRDFEYTVLMESPQADTKIWKFRNTVDGRLKFPLTAKPHEHLQMLVDNLNRRGSGWTVGDCIDGAEQLINYDHDYCWDALGKMAEKFKTEFEIDGKRISLKKIEYDKDNPLALSYGKGNGFRSGIGRTSEGNPPVEFLFVQGGTRNIDRSKYGSSELLLPKNQTLTYNGRVYKVDDRGLSISRYDKQPSSYAEDSLSLEDIYPHREGVVSELITVDADKHLYDFTDTANTVDYDDCLIEGEKMTVSFQTGMLAGHGEFEVKYFHAAKGDKKAKRFELVPKEEDGYMMPDATFKPAAGDKYIVLNIMLPDEYIADNEHQTGAEWDMFREAVRYMYDHEDNEFSFTGELDPLWASQDWANIGGKIRLGGYVSFSDTRFQPSGVLVRIIGVKDYINKPHKPEIQLSNKPVFPSFLSELRQIEAQEVQIEETRRDALSFTKRRFRDAQETMAMLNDLLEAGFDNFTNNITPISIQTMQMLVGDESLQYRFVNNTTTPSAVAHNVSYDAGERQLSAPQGIIQHLTLGINTLSNTHSATEYKYWTITAFTSAKLTDPAKKYFLYIRVLRSDTTGVFVLRETAISMTADASYYYFLYGILNSEYEGTRSFVPLYGFTEILPGRVTTDRVISGDGNSYFDMQNNAMKLGDLLKFNISGNGKLVLKGTFVQSSGGEDESPIGCYRGEYNASYVYYYGDEVSYTTNGYTATYRYINETPSSGHAPTETAYWQIIAKGANAEHIVSVFKCVADGLTPVKPSGSAYPPIGWNVNPPTRNVGYTLWMSQCIISGDGTYGTWSTPVRISGDKGNTGEDGTDIEFIYKQSNSLPSDSDTPVSLDEDDAVPTGWSDSPNGVSLEYKYEWMCLRTKPSGSSSWTNWSTPVVWSAYGDQGLDGDGFESVFKRTTTETAPSISDSGTVDGKTKDDDDFVPSGWTDDPVGVTSSYKYEWVSVRKKHLGEWGSFSTPTLWATYSEQGARIVSVFRCIAEGTTPQAPTQQAYPPTNWAVNPPTRLNGYVLWMSLCTISGTGTFGSWSNPVRLSGDKGNTGADGKDIEFIYKQSTTLPSSGDTPTSVNVDDYVPDGWSDNPQGVSTSYKYEWMSMREKPRGATSWGNFSEPVVWSAYGDQGLDGDGFEYIFKRFTSEQDGVPTPMSQNTDGYVPTGWTNNPSGVSASYPYEYVSMRKKTNGTWGQFSTPAVWAKYGANGNNGDFFEYRYAVGGSPTVYPNIDVTARTPSGWDTTPSPVGALQYLWVTVAKISGRTNVLLQNWSTPVRQTAVDAVALNENLVDNSEEAETYSVIASGADNDSTPPSQFQQTQKRLCRIPPSGTVISCQVRVTLSGCSFRSGGASVLVYMNGTNSWPTVGQKTGITANGTYDLKTENLTFNWNSGTMYKPINIRLNNFYAGGTITIERVKVEISPRCSAWSLSEFDKRGPAITYRKEYDSTKTYVGNSLHIDCVKYNGIYYAARSDAGEFSGIVPTNDDYWNVFGGQFESVATELLLAEFAYIENLGVRDLQTAETGKRVHISADENAMTIYDDDEQASAIFSGDQFSDSELFGGADLPVSPASINRTYQTGNALHPNNTYTDSTLNLGTFTFNYAGVFSGSVSLRIRSTGSYSLKPREPSMTFSAYVQVFIDNALIGMCNISDVPDDDSVTLNFSKQIMAGGHTVKAKVVVNNPNYTDSSSYTITVTGSWSGCKASADIRMARYFANGQAVGCSSEQFVESVIENNKMLHKVRSGGAGFSVNDGVFKIRLGGTEYTATPVILSSGDRVLKLT